MGLLKAVWQSGLHRVQTGWLRLRKSWLAVTQCALGAALAYFVAHSLFGHPQPFFAPTAAMVSIEFSSRVRRSVELMIGVSIGVGIGGMFISGVGPGPWQLALVVAVAMVIAIMLDGGTLVPMQAAGSAVLVATLLPPQSAVAGQRMVDAVIGGLVGVFVVAVIPANPVRRSRRQAADIVGVMASALTQCANGLHEQDSEQIRRALESARQTQPQLDALRTSLAGGREVVRVSPLYWRDRARLQTLRAAADPLDNAVRNTRVLLRRALTLVRDDEILDPRLVDEVERLGAVSYLMHRYLLADVGEQPDVVVVTRELRWVAKAATKDLVSNAGVSANAVFAQIRSIIVDLMQMCGVQRVSALALLPPTVPHPYVDPVD